MLIVDTPRGMIMHSSKLKYVCLVTGLVFGLTPAVLLAEATTDHKVTMEHGKEKRKEMEEKRQEKRKAMEEKRKERREKRKERKEEHREHKQERMKEHKEHVENHTQQIKDKGPEPY